MKNNKKTIFINKHIIKDENLIIEESGKSDENCLKSVENNNFRDKLKNDKNTPKKINPFKYKCITHCTLEKNTDRNEFINNHKIINTIIPLKYKKGLEKNNRDDYTNKKENSNTQEIKEAISTLYKNVDKNKKYEDLSSVLTRRENIKNNNNNYRFIKLKKNNLNNLIKNNIIDDQSNTMISFKKSSINENSNNDFIIHKCLFCDKLSGNNKYNSFFTCGHFFCMKCGKIFYEEMIEMMINENNYSKLNCPVIDCFKVIPLPLIKKIISDEYYNKYIEFYKDYDKNNKDEETSIYNNKNKKEIYAMNTEIMRKNEIKTKYKKKLNKEQHKYLQQNIIDLNSFQKYIYYTGKSYERCPFCKDYSIYDKIGGNYVKCLRCMKRYCKYCHKVFDNSHLDITKVDHCKVFYRSHKDYIQQKFYYKFFFNIAYVIGGYLFILTFFILKTKRALKNNRSIFQKILKAFYYVILFIICLPLCIIILPYFPMIISL